MKKGSLRVCCGFHIKIDKQDIYSCSLFDLEWQTEKLGQECKLRGSEESLEDLG